MITLGMVQYPAFFFEPFDYFPTIHDVYSTHQRLECKIRKGIAQCYELITNIRTHFEWKVQAIKNEIRRCNGTHLMTLS